MLLPDENAGTQMVLFHLLKLYLIHKLHSFYACEQGLSKFIVLGVTSVLLEYDIKILLLCLSFRAS